MTCIKALLLYMMHAGMSVFVLPLYSYLPQKKTSAPDHPEIDCQTSEYCTKKKLSSHIYVECLQENDATHRMDDVATIPNLLCSL